MNVPPNCPHCCLPRSRHHKGHQDAPPCSLILACSNRLNGFPRLLFLEVPWLIDAVKPTPHTPSEVIFRDPKPGSRDYGGLHGPIREGIRQGFRTVWQFWEDKRVGGVCMFKGKEQEPEAIGKSKGLTFSVHKPTSRSQSDALSHQSLRSI